MTTSTPYLVSLEDHFISSAFEKGVTERLGLHQFPGPLRRQLTDVGQERLDVMSEARIRLQVVSHVPFPLDTKSCIAANDQLHAHCLNHPGRLAGFAALPVTEPGSVAKEFKRCVQDLGFVGALIPNHAAGVYYDGKEYDEMWATAVSLDVPVYLHPCIPTEAKALSFRGAYSNDASFAIGTHAWDWHADCGMHFVRLYASGLFDRYPDLKIVLGHLGELLPFMLGRTERKLALTSDSKNWKRSFGEAYTHNVWVTTSGMFDNEVFQLVKSVTSLHHIMFSVDYPFESSTRSVEFLKSLREGVLSDEEYSKVANENAEALLRVGKP